MMWNSQDVYSNERTENIMMIVMRRTSLTTEQAKELARIFRKRREEKGLSIRQLAAAANVHLGTVSGLEHGTNLAPQPEILKTIARVLELSMSDLFLIADWLPVDELPSLQPYLRAKYGLGESDAAEIDHYLMRLREQRGNRDGRGPIAREDEH
jgi:transcriptional regulator with XRE-family HTH domain